MWKHGLTQQTLPETQRTQILTWTKFGNNMAPHQLHSLQFLPPDGATCISCIFGHQIQSLAIRWRHLHCLQSWPPGCVTCIAPLPWIALLAVSIGLVSSSSSRKSYFGGFLWLTSIAQQRIALYLITAHSTVLTCVPLSLSLTQPTPPCFKCFSNCFDWSAMKMPNMLMDTTDHPKKREQILTWSICYSILCQPLEGS